jgi:hypothetical protein
MLVPVIARALALVWNLTKLACHNHTEQYRKRNTPVAHSHRFSALADRSLANGIIILLIINLT